MSALDDKYNQLINEHRNYLIQVQEAFNKHCDEITAETQAKIAQIPETSQEARQPIFEEHKKKLATALSEMRALITKSTNMVRLKLEEIHTEREALQLKRLEDFMNTLKK
ncbi:hypothetical protein IT413_02025 [Candidatus Peregrinibacteria bacterium]|nr:hypothetical protein [Candidatus Peregrinibacteria bacterium]